MIYVLDACAMIAFLRDEAGAEVVEQALLETDSQCIAHSINLCEIFYVVWRDGGEVAATETVDDLAAVGVVERNDSDQEFWREVGKLKAVQKKVSLADCCAICADEPRRRNAVDIRPPRTRFGRGGGSLQYHVH